MSPESSFGGKQSRVVAVVVTYQPEIESLTNLLAALTPQVQDVVLVDNGSHEDLVNHLETLATTFDFQFVALRDNMGIAEAQNIGIERARDLGASFILLSDQDSLPEPDMVARLLEAYHDATARGIPVGALGPIAIDKRNPSEPLLFSDHRWGPRRAELTNTPGDLIEASFLIASGCLIPLQVLEKVGPMNSAWFIDHIDLEWGMRARAKGLRMFGVVGATLYHSLGDSTARPPGRSRDIHIHAPIRNYYMVRNSIFLTQSRFMPVPWRIGYVGWIIKYSVYYCLFSTSRWKRCKLIFRGFLDGFLRRAGKLRAS